MAATSRNGKVLLTLGILLVAVDGLGLTAFGGPLHVLAPVTDFWWLLVLAGVSLMLLPRLATSASVPFFGVGGSATHDRQDIIAATDWSRLGTDAFRNSYGIALTASAAVLFVLALGLQAFGLVALWVGAMIVGALVIAITWRSSNSIIEDYTRTITVRAPDNFAAHSFHIALRQQAEDLGYRIVSTTSPTEGGQRSAVADEIFHANGGFRARNRPIEESRPLAPEVEDEYLERVLTVATLGVFVSLLGVTLVSVDLGGPAVRALGAVLFVVGVAIVAYDYAIRTREWAELYCVEEGTIYSTTVNHYADDVLDAFDSPKLEPNASTTETAAVLSVTVSGTCTPLYGEENVEADFEALADAVEAAADDYRFEVVDEGREDTTDETLAYDEDETATQA
ncbi:hypothetical protein [Natrinema salaciae]|uniref:Uncharacterized protein n=1 Tax=Natrinema salaciae TaxID=1186196 RepID=A0A1H9KBJ2_9EURY|nr:hypothetical protein [Natrinema salaciae]SEQ96253.1 hypothetical protein SAMN04489841_2861 [Natrinema salaciae]